MIERLRRNLAFGMVFITCGCSPYNCEEVNRPLSDKELIGRAVRHEARSGKMAVSGSGKSVDEFLANSVDEFLASYPNCCQVSRRGKLEVDMYYKLAKPQSPEYQYYEQHLVVDACGKGLHGYGMSVKDQERPCWAREEKVSKLSDTELVRAALTKAAQQMKLDTSPQSIDRFLAEHPSCCQVTRNVQDKLYPVLLNAAQVEVYYLAQEEEMKRSVGFSKILVAFNACADFGHMYGPERLDQRPVPEWVK